MKTLVSYAWKAFACGLVYSVGIMLGAALAMALGVSLPTAPRGAEPGQLALLSFLASFVLGASLGPLASGLRSRYRLRLGALAVLTYVCLAVNTALETTIFTTVGGGGGMLVLFLPATLACAAAAAALFHPAAPLGSSRVLWPRFAGQFSAVSWAWRLVAALVAFPVVYLTFGMIVGPHVIDAYRDNAYGLTLPTWSQIVPIQFLRSALFLIATLPAIVLWIGSRPRLALSLGLAHYAFVGLFGMLQAYWLPTRLRLLHGAELGADSFAYAALLVLLLVRRSAAGRPVAEASARVVA